MYRLTQSVRFFSSSQTTTVLARYSEMVKSGKIRSDLNQIAAITLLDQWKTNFETQSSRIVKYKDNYGKISDFG